MQGAALKAENNIQPMRHVDALLEAVVLGTFHDDVTVLRVPAADSNGTEWPEGLDGETRKGV